jgi:hypothetical protein
LTRDRELNQPSDPDLLGVAQLLKHDLVKRRQRTLGVSLSQLSAISDGSDHLRLAPAGSG